MPQRQQRITFGKIAGDATFGDVVFNDLEAVYLAVDSVVDGRRQGDGLAFRQTEAVDVIAVHQHDVTGAVDSAKPVIVVVDGRVELPIAAQGNQLHHVTLIRRHIDIG